jgi:hypothetical protein
MNESSEQLANSTAIASRTSVRRLFILAESVTLAAGDQLSKNRPRWQR